jgi:uncharacterized protein (TIGR03118 family)
MKRNTQVAVFVMVALAVAIFAALSRSTAQPVGSFLVTNLTGSAGTGAPNTDAHMINAWGNAFFPGNPFWVNDQGTGVSELIDGQGKISQQLPLVTIPPANAGQPGQPTGIVANGTSDFGINGGPALFIFDTEDGTISAWNQSSGGAASIVVNKSGSKSYTGLALAKNGAANQLYAANQGVGGQPGSIDVYSATFGAGTATGGFTDPQLPANFQPYNVQALNGNLFVAYFKGLQSVGQVDEFDPNGTLIMRFTSDTLKAPWGLVIAPANFGAFGGDLLVGNLIDGTIDAFNPTNGEFLGQLADTKSNLISIPGLWSLIDGTGALNAQSGAIYFTAGPSGYASGLFGMIQPAAASATPTATPTATPKGKPKKTPKPTKTPKPKKTPKPTKTPKAKKTPKPTVGGTGTPTGTPTPYMGYGY